MQTEKLILHPWQEVVGTVDSVEKFEKRGVLRISLIRCISLEIPFIDLRERSVNLVLLTGQKISILRTDHDYILKQSEPDGDIGSKAP